MHGTKEQMARLDALADQWYYTPQEGNDALRKSREEQLLLVLMEMLEPAELDVLGLFWEKVLPAYRPEGVDRVTGQMKKYSFASHTQVSLKRLCLQADYEANNMKRIRKRDPATGRTESRWETRLVSLDASSQEDGFALEERLPDPVDRYAAVESAARLMELLARVAAIPERLSGQANNPARRLYYRLFFTDGCSWWLWEEKELPEDLDEPLLLGAMRMSFLDFLLTRVCRDIPAIADCPRKQYGEMVAGAAMVPAGRPLPLDVYTTYLASHEGRTAGAAAISQQRTAYEAVVLELLR